MKKNLLLKVSILLLLFACSFSKNGFKKSIKLPDEGKYSINIPKDVTEEYLIKGLHGGEYQYVFSDSSFLYISSDEGSATKNDSIVRNQKNSITPEFVNNEFKYPTAYSGEVAGKLWKELHLQEGKIKIGYLNVESSRKDEFDKSLQSFK